MCYKKNVTFAIMGDKNHTLLLIAHFSKYDVHETNNYHISITHHYHPYSHSLSILPRTLS